MAQGGVQVECRYRMEGRGEPAREIEKEWLLGKRQVRRLGVDHWVGQSKGHQWP